MLSRLTLCAVLTLPLFAGTNQWTSRGPEGGSFGRVAAANGHYYVPLYGGGVYESDDGLHWTPMSGLEDLLALQVVLSRDAQVVDVRTSNGNIFERRDGSWKKIGAFGYVASITRNSQTDVLYAVADNRVQRYVDEVWSVIPTPATIATKFGAIGNAMMVWISGASPAIYISSDEGAHWNPIPRLAANETPLAFSVDALRGRFVVAGSLNAYEYIVQSGIWFPAADLFDALYPCNACTVSDIEADGDSLILSTNTGVTVVTGNNTWYLNQPDGIQPNYLSATDTYYFASGSGGLFIARKDRGFWTSLNNAFSANPTYQLTKVGERLYAGTATGIFIADGADPFKRLTRTYARIAVANDDRKTIYAAIGSDVQSSTDGGVNWDLTRSRNGSKDSYVYAIAVPVLASSSVWLMDEGGVWRSDDRGSRWERVSDPIASAIQEDGFYYSRLALDPTDPATLYVSAVNTIFRFDSNGWTRLPYDGVSFTLAVDNAGRVFSFDDKGTFVSDDRGSSWRRSTSDIDGWAIASVAFDPAHPNVAYAGGRNGVVYRTTNGGMTWYPFGDGLSTAAVNSLLVDDKRVYAATSAGVYEYTIDEKYLSAAATHSISLRTWYGNFVSVDSTDRLVANAAAEEMLTLYDANGGQLLDGDLIYLRDVRGDFIAAEGAGANECGGCVSPLNANRALAGAWESFKVRRLAGPGPISSGDAIALVSRSGNYVTAENGGAASCGCDSPLHANRFAALAWETFILKME